jgi:hypothetical protein
MDTYYFSLTDIDGNIMSTKEISAPADEQPITSNKLPYVGFIERDNFIYVFFGYMLVVKLTKTGDVVWLKSFATEHDRFRSVIVNNKGNFVMMGEHHFDAQKQQYTDYDGERDLIFIEIDENGNYLFKK